ncbi:MAG: hypothetical protein VXX95_06480 [Candidatus Thermoplasmatota archaeon]|nr:hypothetical protein [Candidatus Thermoplasmatota archaeon]
MTESRALPAIFIDLMKLRVVVLLQITAVCAILVHDLLVGAGYLVFADADGFPEGLSLLHLVLGVTAAVVAISVTMMSRLVSPLDHEGGSE